MHPRGAPRTGASSPVTPSGSRHALGYSLGIHYTSVPVMFGAGLLMLWLLLAAYSARNLPAKAFLTLAGHLRARPDPWLECALRQALADFDRELTVILQDRGMPTRPIVPTQPVHPSRQEPSSGSADKP